MTPTIEEIKKIDVLVEKLVKIGFKHVLEKGARISDWARKNREVLNLAGCTVSNGMTRAVVIPFEGRWVLKFDFLGALAASYNKRECRNYQLARENGLEKYFAPIYYLDFLHGLDVYVQEKVRVDEDRTSDSFLNFTLETYYEGRDCDDEEVYDEACSDSDELDNEDRICAMIYSPDTKKLVDFVYEYDINDLHCGNWGYRMDEPVLIDYAGYE